MNTTVYFHDRVSGENAIGHCDLSIESILDYIEEQLYILWDLTPSARDWKQLFSRFKYAQFDYHGADPVNMWKRWLNSDGSEIEVILEGVN